MKKPADASGASVQQQMIRGSAWMIAWRWSIRGIGLVSTIALARLLTPADFGLVAMATLAVGLIEAFGDADFKLAIIRHPNPTRDHLDTAWTLGILTGTVVALALVVLAPAAAAYFNEPRVVLVIRFLALRAFIDRVELFFGHRRTEKRTFSTFARAVLYVKDGALPTAYLSTMT